jgi:hypothetical protein
MDSVSVVNPGGPRSGVTKRKYQVRPRGPWWVGELPSLRNTRKRDKTKQDEILSICFEKGKGFYDMGFLCKNICVVFSNSPSRETPKNIKTKKKVGW